MATKTVLVDDMDGGDADVTIAFALNGEGYSMDLSSKNADAFYAALEPWLSVATRNRSARDEAVRGHLVGVEQRAAIREWAAKRGMEISQRGRIPQEVTDEFNRTNRSGR
jgi:hypothetical protein